MIAIKLIMRRQTWEVRS